MDNINNDERMRGARVSCGGAVPQAVAAPGQRQSSRSSGRGGFLPETVSPVTATQLLRARLRGEHDSLRSMLTGGELDVRDAARLGA